MPSMNQSFERRAPWVALRGALGMGLTWGALWGVVAVSAILIIAAVDPAQIDRGEGPIELGPWIGLAGFGCGVLFGVLLSIAERWKPILEVPPIRVALWGALVSAALPLVMGKGISQALVTIPLGVVSAMASLVVARAWARWRVA